LGDFPSISSTVQRPQSSNHRPNPHCSSHSSAFRRPSVPEKQVKSLAHFDPEVIAMQFWDAYYLERIQKMKARRKAEMEEAGKL